MDPVAQGRAEFRARQEEALRRNPERLLEAVLSQARQVTGSASSADGSVQVTVDYLGMPTRLESARDADAGVILRAVQLAASRARDEVRGLYTPLVEAKIIDDYPGLLPQAAKPAEPAAEPVVEEDEPAEPVFREDAW
ncbi:hypothetical protein SAMN05421504_102175 [Amycolatopsis xylanica]|uniref:YbaB/EbfC DNA-binding family protein n=1 Tax=Amycolatopsis xylanica TaxID=589385 RepID=A0A1H2YL64_9PSEU|nr:hypothetical protein [Amycolatopsis xylanica]SDX05917.1 hypothetical protein SAMN05421504_102175 [Amycolatopsis xylanica]